MRGVLCTVWMSSSPACFRRATRPPGKEHSVKRTVHLTIAAGGVCAAVLALAAPATAAPQASPSLSASALAAQSADAFVAAQPSALFASAGEQFVQRGVTSSAGLQFVSYDRTFRNLPVIGGD